MLRTLLKKYSSFMTALVLVLVVAPSSDAAAIRGEILSTQRILTLSAEEVNELEEENDLPVTEDTSLIPAPIVFYQVTYSTPATDGTMTTASGLFIIPNARNPMPLLSYQHGTLTKKSDAPSIWPLSDEAIFATLLFAIRGYSVSLPDGLGLGLGKTSFHPFLHAESEASSAIDFLRASQSLARKKRARLSGELFLSGYSQGGHWTLALQRELEKQPLSSLRLIATSAMAGPFDLSDTTLKKLLEKPGKYSAAYTACLLYGYQMIYQDIVPCWDNVFQQPYASRIAELFTGKKSLDAIYRKLAKTPKDLFLPDYLTALESNPSHPFRLALAKNDVYDWTPKSPLLLIHSKGDTESPFENSLKAATLMKNRGAPVELILLKKRYSHVGAFFPAYLITANRFERLRRTYEN